MRALVLGSGGARIAYHAGAVRRLAEKGMTFSIFSGNSAGALVAALLAQAPDLSIGAASLAKIAGLESRDVWRPWPVVGKLAGLWKPAIVNNAPFQRLARDSLSAERILKNGKKLRVGAVNVRTGENRIFREIEPCIVEAVIASASIPGVFEPIEIGAELWSDGAMRDVAPIKAAIEAGATEIWCVLLRPKTRYYQQSRNALDAISNAIDAMQSEILEGDLYGAALNSTLARVRATDKREIAIRIIRPKTELIPNDVSFLDFSPERSAEIAARGYLDAKEVIG